MAFRAGGLRYPPQPTCSLRPAKGRRLPQHANLVDVRDAPSRSGCSESVQNGRVLSGQKLEPSYSNNVVGGSSRRKTIASNGIPPAKRLRVAVDVDEGNIQRSLHKLLIIELKLTFTSNKLPNSTLACPKFEVL